MRITSRKVVAIVAALVVLGAAPAAHARWPYHSGLPTDDRMDLSVRVGSRWLGHGRRDTFDSLVVERVARDRTVTTLVRIRASSRVLDSARLRGCDRHVRYEIDGIDVTRELASGGYEVTRLEEGATIVRVIARRLPPWDVSCRISVTANGRLHDGLTLNFVR